MSPEPSPRDATDIARRQFSTTRRGYDPAEVRAFLHELSDVVGRLERAEAQQRERADRAEARAELAERLDEHRLVELLGQETVRVLDAARDAATDIRAKAEESAARLVRDAQGEAHSVVERAEQEGVVRRREIVSEAEQLRRDAEAVVELRRAEGQELVDEMRRGAEAERDRMLAEGYEARERAEEEAERVRDAGREQGRRLVGEAQAVRERMLGDLARRRRTAREQLERLNAARERLLAAYEVVRRTVDEATVELTVALPQAKAAAQTAMRRVSEEPEPTVEELEAELAVARMAGIVDEPDTAQDAAQIDALIDGAIDASDLQLEDTEAGEAGEPPAAAEEESAEARSPGRGIWPFRRRPVPAAAEPAEAVEPAEPTEPVPVASVAPDDDAGADPGDLDSDHDDQSDVDELFARLKADHDAPGSAPEAAGAAANGTEVSEAADLAGGAVAVMQEATASEAKTDDDGQAEAAADEAEGDEDDDPDAAPLRERDARLEPVERHLGRRLKRALADEQNEVFDLLRRAEPGGLDDVVPEAIEHAQRYAAAALTDLDAAATGGAASVEGEVSGSCSALAGELGEVLVEPLRERIAASFDECDGDLEEITERLRSLYREWKAQRIGPAVRHYTAAAYAWGVYEATPTDAELLWLVDRQGDDCPDAEDNALAGGIRKGELFPTGVRCSPAHPDCRCLVVPADVPLPGAADAQATEPSPRQ